MGKLRLDGALRKQLSSDGTNWDSLGVNGLGGQHVYPAFFEAGFTGSVPNQRGHIEYPVKKYKKPRIKNGKVITHRQLKPRRIDSQVYFACDDYEAPIQASRPEEKQERVSEERWNGYRIDMNGCIGSRNRRPSKKRGQ